MSNSNLVLCSYLYFDESTNTVIENPHRQSDGYLYVFRSDEEAENFLRLNYHDIWTYIHGRKTHAWSNGYLKKKKFDEYLYEFDEDELSTINYLKQKAEADE